MLCPLPFMASKHAFREHVFCRVHLFSQPDRLAKTVIDQTFTGVDFRTFDNNLAESVLDALTLNP